jgi:hypothetical protein
MAADFQTRAQTRKRYEIDVVPVDCILLKRVAGVQREIAPDDFGIRDAVGFDRDVVDPSASVRHGYHRGTFGRRSRRCGTDPDGREDQKRDDRDDGEGQTTQK